ncbi:interferon-induced 6-16 family-domain-containing protein [Catenaria anguillulae PL171]|uniref:Interferon-induced 6-16 family-domain-containing protein n=1 Tax=Catenaria anguillulae PL171 TaxID=765915 RepID=A0A1Y2H5I0_9FUNG|nr:interferon-induced 6-16 family-domain-containing protein [Catenaria anguillulae PL171]
MQVPVNYAILVAVSSPDELRDWILDASHTDQDAFMERYLPRLLSGELAVTPTIEVWQVALRFCQGYHERLTQALDGNPDNKTLLDLVTLYDNYIEVINKKILDFNQLSGRSKLHGSESNASPDGTAESGPSAADAAKVAGTAAAAAVAAPLAANAATVGIVSALGFQAGGVAAGSTAASMMSAAAVANGGGVAAGSTVAVMQSIGATGLAFGPVGWVALGVAGAAIGATVGVKYMMDKSKK